MSFSSLKPLEEILYWNEPSRLHSCTETKDSSYDESLKRAMRCSKTDQEIMEKEVTLTSKEPFKILQLLESSAKNYQLDKNLILEVSKYLKANGLYLDEGPRKKILDHYFKIVEDIIENENLALTLRAKMLELVELRACNWKLEEKSNEFYIEKVSLLDNSKRSKISQQESHKENIPISASPLEKSNSSSVLHPKPIGFSKPVKISAMIPRTDDSKFKPIYTNAEIISDFKKTTSPIAHGPLLADQAQQPESVSLAPVQVSVFSGVSAANLPYIQALPIRDELMIISSSSEKLAKEALDVLRKHFYRNAQSPVHNHAIPSQEKSTNNSNSASQVSNFQSRTSLRFFRDTQDSGASPQTNHSLTRKVYHRDFLMELSRTSLSWSKPEFYFNLKEQFPKIITQPREPRGWPS